MKRTIVTLLMLVALILASCSTSPGTTATATSTNVLPIQTQLLLGSIKLDGTGQTITAAQAAELIPLWQVYQELLTSDTAAQEEMDALVTQIQETMTTEQLQAIQAMNLTEQDVVLALQEQGVSSNVAQSNTAATSISMVGGAPGGGEMPAGDIPAGDMPPENMGQAAGSSSATTLQTAQVQPVESFPTGLIDVLVQMLENKVA